MNRYENAWFRLLQRHRTTEQIELGTPPAAPIRAAATLLYWCAKAPIYLIATMPRRIKR